MSTLVGLQETQRAELPSWKPLDEAVWQAWVAKGRAQERRDSAALVKAVKWVAIVGLFAAAGLWSQIAPYELVFKFIVSAGAIVVMFQAFRTRHYAFAAVFAALVLLYNPVAPLFSFTGDWQRFLVVASVLPFIAALAWLNRTEADNAQA